MKYAPEIYAKAIFDSVTAAPAREHAVYLERFVQILARNGDMAQASKVIRALETLLIEADGGRRVLLEFARTPNEKQRASLLSAFSGDTVEVVSNPELVAGVRIVINGEHELDYSLSRRLKKLFR